jgi:hypothetical protein
MKVFIVFLPWHERKLSAISHKRAPTARNPDAFDQIRKTRTQKRRNWSVAHLKKGIRGQVFALRGHLLWSLVESYISRTFRGRLVFLKVLSLYYLPVSSQPTPRHQAFGKTGSGGTGHTAWLQTLRACRRKLDLCCINLIYICGIAIRTALTISIQCHGSAPKLDKVPDNLDIFEVVNVLACDLTV